MPTKMINHPFHSIPSQFQSHSDPVLGERLVTHYTTSPGRSSRCPHQLWGGRCATKQLSGSNAVSLCGAQDFSFSPVAYE